MTGLHKSARKVVVLDAWVITSHRTHK